MKVTIVAISIILLSFATFLTADSDFSIPLSRVLDKQLNLDLDEMYVAFDAGIGRIIDGKSKIEMDVNPELYYVVLTPLTESGSLFYSQVEEGGFVVTEEGTKTSGDHVVEFQYIVFAPISKLNIPEKPVKPNDQSISIIDRDEGIGISTISPIIQPFSPNSEQPVKKTD